MAKWRIYYNMSGDVVIDGPDTEEEARAAFHDLSQNVISDNLYGNSPEIDDLAYEGD